MIIEKEKKKNWMKKIDYIKKKTSPFKRNKENEKTKKKEGIKKYKKK